MAKIESVCGEVITSDYIFSLVYAVLYFDLNLLLAILHYSNILNKSIARILWFAVFFDFGCAAFRKAFYVRIYAYVCACVGLVMNWVHEMSAIMTFYY